MSFSENFSRLSSILNSNYNIKIYEENYDGFIVKQMSESNYIKKNFSNKKSYISITGNQIDLFPYIYSRKFIVEDDPKLKNYFVFKALVNIFKNNCDKISKGYIEFNNKNALREEMCIYPRKGGKQIRLSMKQEGDSKNFFKFRELMKPNDYFVVLKKDRLLEYDIFIIEQKYIEDNRFKNLSEYKVRGTEDITFVRDLDIVKERNIKSLNSSTIIGRNIILYGVPGSGKSYTIKNEYCNDFNFMERIVFHPDYMNTDFIGQILPSVDNNGKISYEFKAGAFTRILKKAIEDRENHYYLVIEEINRGNAPAIFGEVFQLLDRESNGESSYKINNKDMAKVIYGNANENAPIYIPSNLTILATMNTADQNVFTLDTAFQRRWDMKLIKNDISKVPYAATKILDTSVTWEKFNRVMNTQILSMNKGLLSSEDKRLGAFFVSEEVVRGNVGALENKINSSLFAEKVIKYLWDDVFKFKRNDIFDVEYNCLDELIDKFNMSTSEARWDIFNDNIKSELLNSNKDIQED